MIGVIADVHGNYPALSSTLDRLHELGCSEIICLGDVAGYSCMINECIHRLREEKVISLKGNHDSYLLGESSCPRSRSANRCIDYQKDTITNDNMRWLERLRPTLLSSNYFAMHGGFNDPLDEYVYDFDFADPRIHDYDCRVFLTGHTHIQVVEHSEDIVHCNPGSVGQPRDHDARAAYATLDNGKIALGRVEYDINEIARAMKRAGFGEYYYTNLYYGCKIGEKIDNGSREC